MVELNSPHIPLGLAVDKAVAILQRFGNPVRDDSDRECCYRIDTPLFRFAVYPEGNVIRSVWYDDPIGRESELGRSDKVQAYLMRYGALKDWERRLDNGWMHYWFNPSAHAQMVYGVDMDVIRFNQYSEEHA